MYSRYTPPKKKQKTCPAPPPLISATKQKPSPVEHVAHIKLDASSTYMRHVPSSKGTSSRQADKPVKDVAQSSGRKPNSTVLDNVDISVRIVDDGSIENGSGVLCIDAMDGDTPTKKGEERKSEKHASDPKDVVRGVDADGESEEDTRHASIIARRDKSLQLAEKLTKKVAKKTMEGNERDIDEDVDMEEPTNLHSLEPLPQPEPLPESTSEPKFSALPLWMRFPVKVSPTATVSFSKFGIHENVISSLRASGFSEAFAVQAAVLPLLLPGPQEKFCDVVVSAATGSGKTLAYVLPMIEDISSNVITKLSGLIVVPTKELVLQAKAVCDICATAFSDHRRHNKHITVGIAMGDQSLKKEQDTLMNKGQSKVAILISTPGRLVEHLNSTLGFTLQNLNWLVIDEADKLLGQSFQEWIEVVMAHLPTPSPSVFVRNDVKAKLNTSSERSLRKIVLSATMTNDTGLLSALKLNRPKLVVLEGERNDAGASKDGEIFILPSTLHETAIKVHDDGDKPLYLVELLRSCNMMGLDSPEDDDSSSTALSSDDDSEPRMDDESSPSEESSDKQSTPHTIPTKEKRSAQAITKTRGVIVFTKSNENALRLCRLLTLIDPKFKDIAGTVVRDIPEKTRRKTLSAFQSGKLSVLVASDLASRGLDILNLANVVNYDVPSSLSSYVHRVGRTARAGKKGHAWTLYTKTEAAWFLNEITRSNLVNRNSRKVEMSKIDPNVFGDELRNHYEKALELLGQEAKGHK